MTTTNLLELIAVLIFGSLVAGLAIVAKQRDQLKLEAIKHGAAEWIVDDTGNATFQWKTKQ